MAPPGTAVVGAASRVGDGRGRDGQRPDVLRFLVPPGRRQRVAYDAGLAERVRRALAGQEDVREVRMFGGLAFMVGGRMVACVSGGGGALLVRVSRGRDAEYLEVVGARRAEMGKGRSMGEGWITVDGDALMADADLHFWTDAVLEYNAEETAERRPDGPSDRPNRPVD
ncbi:TfoX/Sxy family protein [Geodermatophilus sp. SYSU D00697]